MPNQSAFEPPQERVRADARCVGLTSAPCVHLILLALASCTHFLFVYQAYHPWLPHLQEGGQTYQPSCEELDGASEMVGLDIGSVFGSKQPHGAMLPVIPFSPFSSIPEETVLVLLAMNINNFRQKLTLRVPCQSDWLQTSILKIELISVILLSSWSGLSNLANLYSFFQPFTPHFFFHVFLRMLCLSTLWQKEEICHCV